MEPSDDKHPSSSSSSAYGKTYQPYESDFLSPLEAEVLNEHARLSSNFDKLANLVQQLSNLQPDLLESIRPLEARLGLVLTLFKASVWATFVTKEADNNNSDNNHYNGYTDDTETAGASDPLTSPQHHH